MPEEGSGLTPGAEEATEPQSGGSPAEEAAKYTQADLDNILGKKTAGLQKKLTAAEKAAEEARKQAMTEDEKRIQAAKDEAVADYEAKLKQSDRVAEIKLELASRGLSREQIGAASKLVDAEIDDPAEAVSALSETFPQLFNNSRTLPGGGGGKAPAGTLPSAWTDEAIQEQTEGMNPTELHAFWTKHGKSIREYEEAHSGIRTVAPGQS